MMKIRIENKIRLSEQKQEEIIIEEYEAQQKQLGEKIALSYLNDEKEKVLLSFSEQELTMTRFLDESLGKAKIHFDKHAMGKMNFPGLGEVSVHTDFFELLETEQSLKINYRLAQLGQVFSEHQLKITWN